MNQTFLNNVKRNSVYFFSEIEVFIKFKHCHKINYINILKSNVQSHPKSVYVGDRPIPVSVHTVRAILSKCILSKCLKESQIYLGSKLCGLCTNLPWKEG